MRIINIAAAVITVLFKIIYQYERIIKSIHICIVDNLYSCPAIALLYYLK
jgi:hypothetical protein